MTRPDWQNLNGEWQLRQSDHQRRPAVRHRTCPSGSTCRSRSSRRCPASSAPPTTTATTCSTGAPSPCRPAGPAAGCSCTSAPSTGRPPSGSTACRSARTPAATTRSRSTSPPQLNGGTNELVVQGLRPDRHRGRTAACRRSASRPQTPSGIFYTPTSASGRRSGWSRPPAASISSVDLLPEPGQQHAAGPGVHPRATVTGHTRARRGARRRHRGRHRHRRLHRVHRAGAERAPVVARRPVPLQPAGHAAQRRRRHGRPDDAATSACARSAQAVVNGVLRPMLNGKFVFQIGTLDQGFWPDGLYTAPTDAALRLRPAEAQGPGLQHGPQAHQGRAAALVLPRRPARPAGLAGHAVA